MSNVNKVLLTGNLTADPEIRQTGGGISVTTLRLASNRKYKSGTETKEEVVYVDISVWGALAENCAKYLSKGRSVLVDGRLKLDTWEKDDKKFSKLSVVAENVTFLPSAKGKDEPSEEPQTTPDASPSDVPF